MSAEELTVEALAARGDGIVTHDSKTFFIPGAAPGDRVWMDGTDIIKVEPGPHRADPRCPHFGACGGCSLQQLKDERYASWLSVPIERALAQHKIDADIRPPIVSPPNSRRRAVFTAKVTNGGVVLGFRQKQSHSLEDIEACAVLAPALMNAAAPLKGFLSECLKPGDMTRIHLTQADSGLDVHFESLPLDRLEVLQRVPDLAAGLGRVVRITGQDGPQTDILWQLETPFMRFSGAEVQLPVGAFLQATKEGEVALVKTCMDWVGSAKAAADLFSGIGTFAFHVAEEAKVNAYEASAAAISAIQNAQRPKGMHGVAAHHRDLFRRPLSPHELNAFDLVVFDPPRAGAKAQCAALAQCDVPTLIGISCNPATFARDAEMLVKGGYSLQAVQPVGQFLWSTHVELAALFTRR